MAVSQNDKPKVRVPIPYSKCSEIETDLLKRSLSSRPSNVVFLGETGTGKSSEAQDLYTRWLNGLEQEEKDRREEARESMFEAMLNKKNFEPKYHPIIEKHKKSIPDLKKLPEKPVITNLVGASADTAPAELFGVLPGVFTTVDFRFPRIALANQSMLFIDELRYVPPIVQAQLLTTIQDRAFLPLGGMEKHQIKNLDVWYVAALTPPYNSILPELFYRLGSYVIELRALDQLKGDEVLDELVKRYLAKAVGTSPNAPSLVLSASAMSRLRELNWPGNLRQLENVIHRVVRSVHPTDTVIDAIDIDSAIKFDPAYHLGGNDIVSRLHALFREGAVDKTPFTRKMVDKTLIQVFEAEVGRAKAMKLLQIGRQAFDTLKDKPRQRPKPQGKPKQRPKPQGKSKQRPKPRTKSGDS
ncbi:MAG TPA: sigma 54-interacting transcriptional regulator [Blastocatellia bacterium]|nr:sigma 54-interacting transcriptional regulator [Blastocatellia bacterium]